MLEGRRRYLRAAQAENTTGAYRTGWELFGSLCQAVIPTLLHIHRAP